MLSMDSYIAVREHQSGYRHHWVYIDQGLPVMVVARYDQHEKKTFRQFINDGGEWIEGVCPSPYPLFGLPSLVSCDQTETVYICEGEKCATLLHHLGWPAVTAVLGAQNVDKTDWNPLRYFTRFVILRDNDKAGIEYARAVACRLYRLHTSAEALVVNLVPGLPGGDVVDWAKATVLRGCDWDEFSSPPKDLLNRLNEALQSDIRDKVVSIEECPQVVFKPIEAQFEGLPLPLKISLSPVPDFPIEVFPRVFRDYLQITALQFSESTDYAATAILAAFSGLIGRSVHLQMRPKNPWVETANLWAMLVGRPSAKKSPMMRRILSFYKPLQERAHADYREAMKLHKQQVAKQKNGMKVDGDQNPTLLRYMTDDFTVPSLRSLLAANPRGLLLRSDELKGQLQRLEKFGCEGDRSFMMTCWSGMEQYTEDRIIRGSMINTPLTLTWLGCIPPDALQKYLREAMGSGSGADGFMQRFQFVCYPDTVKDFQLTDQGLSIEAEKAIQELFFSLDHQARAASRNLRFSDDAQFRFDTWLVSNENEARSGNHPGYWESHLGKQSKVVAVVAILLHRLDEALSGTSYEMVSLATLEKALQLQQYYEAHAKRCYESVCGTAVAEANVILKLLKSKRLKSRFKAQDIYHNGLGGLSNSGQVKAALEVLEDHNWLVPEKIPPGPNGGRSHQLWNLHPRAFD